jgi:hypothetical protein
LEARVSDSGDRAGKKGAVFKIDAGKKASLVLDAEANSPPNSFPNGVLLDDADHLLIADFSQGYLFRLDLKTNRLGSGFGGTDGLAKDARGVPSWRGLGIRLVLAELRVRRRKLERALRANCPAVYLADGIT